MGIVVPVRFDRFSSGFGQFVDGDDDVLPGSNLHTSSSLRCGLPNTSSRGGARRRPLRRRRQRRREERRFRGGGGSKTHLLFSSSSVCARVVWRVVLLRVPVSQLIGNIQKKSGARTPVHTTRPRHFFNLCKDPFYRDYYLGFERERERLS